MSKPGGKTREDLTRMLSGVANVASAVRNQARSDIQDRVERIINRMDLVKRSEVEELETMLQQARSRQDELEARLARLEAEKQSESKSSNAKQGSKSSNTKSATKKTTSRKTTKSQGKSGTSQKSS
jgi:BMFP domain-containing protein YqiC